jgi:thiol reductant ABC exporter CydD subunit
VPPAAAPTPLSEAAPERTGRPAGGSVDRRLIARIPSLGAYLAAATLGGAGAAVLVVVQAVLLASVVTRVLLHHVPLSSLGPTYLAFAGAVAGRAACLWASEVAAQRGSAALVRTLRRDVLEHALALGPSWLARERPGELALVTTRGVDDLSVYFGRYLPQVVLAGLVPVGLVVWVGVEDWVSGLVLVAALLLVPALMVLFGREATRRASRQWRRLSSLAARYLELVQGLPTLRALGRSGHGRREVAASTEALRATTMGTLRVAFLSALAMELLSGLGVGLVAMLLGLRLLDGTVGLGTALAVLLVAPESFLPLRRAGAQFHASSEGRAAATRLLEVLATPAPGRGSVSGPPQGLGATAGHRPSRSAPGAHWAGGPVLELRDVVVTYPHRAEAALRVDQLRVDEGEHLGLVGPSGTGKSTLLAVVLGLVRPSGGTVRLGGVDLEHVDLARWRMDTTWVPQRARLVRGSLLDNVRFARPDAADSEVERAVHVAGLDILAARLPLGLDTALGEDGMTVSAGERQRVAIARAVLRDAPVVLLDEPATNLGPEARLELEERLGAWAAQRTVIVAAHRSFLVPVDRVVTLPLGTPHPRAPAYGTASGGTASGGTASDGTASDGTASDGTASDGTASDGTVADAAVADNTVSGRSTGARP